jgi:hypothetical protein
VFNYLVTLFTLAVFVAVVVLFWPWSGLFFGVVVALGLVVALRPVWHR